MLIQERITPGFRSLVCCLFQKMYFFGMKFFFGLILLTGFLSCNDKAKPAEARPKLYPKDSNMVKTETANPYIAVDVSPMDMSYLPPDYPKMSSKKSSPVARVIYSRPHMQGRKIFGSLLKYGEPWRLGANEATEIEIFLPIKIQNKTIPKGKYVLYGILDIDKWTIVFNKNMNSWGLTPDPSKDVFSFDVPVQIKNQSVEYFSIVFQNTPTGADLVMAWDNVEVRLPIQYTEK